MPAEPGIEEATVAASEVLAAIQEQASRAALAHIFLPDEFPFPTDVVRERWRTFGGRLFLAHAGVRPVGFVGLLPPWLEGLYVVPEAWGTGVAARLHDLALDAIRAAGSEAAHLWVLEGNARARRFYERRGWRADGSTRMVPFPPHPIDLGYALPLGPSAGPTS